ncbi:MAG: hypothetical protein AB1333_03020 [Patescibacteria group bacterium]
MANLNENGEFVPMFQFLEENAKKRTSANIKTQSYKKLKNYVEVILQSDFVNEKIKKLRKELEIPDSGFSPVEKRDEYNPSSRFIMPGKWKYIRNKKKWGVLSVEIKTLLDKYYLHYLEWYEVFLNYLFYDEFVEPVDFNSYNLAVVRDLLRDKKDLGEDYECFEEYDNKAYPIAIKISPYMSKRDILDFIEKTYKTEVKPLQNGYKITEVKIGKIKTKKKSIVQRDLFIYDSRQLPHKKIMSLVIERFPDELSVDEGMIGKIISIQKKRRKEV